MAGLGNYEPLGTAVGAVGGQVLIDVRDDRFRETLRVSFQSQDIVGLARNDLLGDGRLCSPRVDGDDRPFGLDQLQEFGNRRDFIRFGLGRDLTQRQSLVRRPQTDRVHAPHPLARSWLRRSVLPSTAETGRVIPVAAAARTGMVCSPLAKQA